MDNSEEKKSKLPNIEGYQIEGALSRTKSTVIFKATSELNRAFVQITLSTGEAYRTSLKPYLDESFPRITKALKLVEHPNVVPMLDAGYSQEMPFTVAPFYAAGSLRQFSGTARNWRDVFSILLPIADALAYCHDHGIIHRDVKPQNIVINDNGDLCLINFSLLEPTVSNKLSVTMTGSGECFPAYIAPEVWNGKYSPAIDQYSFGVMLYELLTATLPFDASNIVSLLVQQATETVAPPSTLIREVPKVVDALIEKILAGDPAGRFENMRDLRNVMQELLNNPNLTQRDVQSGKPPAKSHKTSPPPRPEKKPSHPSGVVQPEQEKQDNGIPRQEKPKKEKALKKKSNTLIIAMIGVLAAVILCATLFLVGLLTDMRIMSGIADKLSVWIESGSLFVFADESVVVSTSTLIALEPTAIQPSKTPLPDLPLTLVVSGVGGATETQYYESSSPSELPKVWVPSTGNTQIGSKGKTFIVPVAIETSDRLGVKLQVFNGLLSSGMVHVYKSSEVEIQKDSHPHIHLLSGSVLVSTEGLPVCITTVLLPEEEIWVRGGQILVESGRIDIKVWCLEGKCELLRDGEWVNTILPLTRSNYFNNGGYAERESNTQILFSLVDELKRYNLECDSCMNVKALYPPK
jgi:serine/threonine protein kinase